MERINISINILLAAGPACYNNGKLICKPGAYVTNAKRLLTKSF